MAARIAGSAAKSTIASASRHSISGVSAFLASGRLNVIMAMSFVLGIEQRRRCHGDQVQGMANLAMIARTLVCISLVAPVVARSASDRPRALS